MLFIENLSCFTDSSNILKNVNLKIKENETHILLGPNGSGKSTLLKSIAGHPLYKVEYAKAIFKKDDLFSLDPSERAAKGIFLGFQNPLEISGITNFDFLHLAYNEKQKKIKKKILTPLEFIALVQPYMTGLDIPLSFLNRNLNESLSGGEKKKNEVLQMLTLKPDLAFFDELDSGLDVDAFKKVCDAIIKYKAKKSSLLFVTHSAKLLQHFKEVKAHLMVQGTILKRGNSDLVQCIEEKGFSYI